MLKKKYFSLALALLLAALTLGSSMAASLDDDGAAGHMTVVSNKSYEQVRQAVESLVAKNGMMVMATVDQGRMLSMTGLRLDAALLLIGNPKVGKTLFQQDRGVGLYVPLRIFIYSGDDGKTRISYDTPSSLLGQFKNPRVEMVARKLDEKMANLTRMAAR